MGRTIDAIISVFPNVANDPMFKITSPKDPDYNCISWSLNKKEVWTWPSTKKGEEDFYWFENIPKDRKPSSFIAGYSSVGYELCEDGTIEKEYDKIVLYSSGGLITHAARQLDNGMWASKLGWWEDVQHSSPKTLEGDFYGKVYCYMKRKK